MGNTEVRLFQLLRVHRADRPDQETDQKEGTRRQQQQPVCLIPATFGDQRQDLNAIEEAQAYQRLLDEFGHTQEALAKAVHKSRSHVANLLRLLDLPAEIQARVVEGTLTMGHARAILGAADPMALADQVVAQGLSVRQTEKLAADVKRGGSGGSAPRRAGFSDHATGSADIEALERQLADLLGLKVHIAFHPEGHGSITLDYSTLDQLDMVCQRLSGERI